MIIPEIDSRNEKDIINQIKKKSLTYTPEWRFDEENPDVGTTLSLIYAKMMSDTINRYNKVLELNRITFFNKIGANLLPAMPAKGYATFSLVNDEVDGVEVKKGTRLSADTGEGSVAFETVNDLFVTPADINHIYVADGADDRIIHLYDKDEFNASPVPFQIFDTSKDNLQLHEMYFCHDSIFNIEHEAWITLHFSPYRLKELPENVLNAFADSKKVSIQYYSEEGYVEFKERRIINGELMLLKEKSQPGFMLTEINEKESYYIKLTVKDIIPFDGFTIKNLSVRSRGSGIGPELVNANGIDQKTQEFYPFSERPYPYAEVYFVSKEVLCKKSAMVNLTFNLDFDIVPMEVQVQETPINWKTIMKRSDFKKDAEYDITIEEVIWEYYNGEGWSRLYPNSQNSKVFNSPQGKFGQTVTIRFQCPDNICPFLINSLSSYSIRARILKMNNLFKLKGNYITPVITNPLFQYDYVQNDIMPEYVIMNNNMEEKTCSGKELVIGSQEIEPFYGVRDKLLTMYLGFEKPPLKGPIKILFSMTDTIDEKLPRLNYEYYGNGRWQILNVIDETENMRKTGVITMIGNSDFMKKTMFQRELYWIRIIDAENTYYNRKYKISPCITGIYMNSTQMAAIETMEEERFTIEANEENKICTLLNQQIFKASVWVNEMKSIYNRDLEKIEKNNRLRYDYDSDGQISAIWVNWNEVESFALSGPEDRHYVLDRINGIVYFSDGRSGRIPTSGDEETILIEYSCGGGVKGNLMPGQITSLDRSIGFINRVTNHEITTGGCNQETVDESLLRNAAAIRHGYRAVTNSDYEALALEATRNILKAKCIANCNADGKKEYGNITLVILQKDYINGKKYFDSVKTQVINYIGPRMNSNLIELNKFHVVEPSFIEINVNAVVVAREYDQVFDIKNKVLMRIKEFINPTTGNFDHKGWEIGTVPNSTQVLNALKNIKDILLIKNLRITGNIRGVSGLIEVDLEKKDSNRFALPVNGTNEIFVEVE